MTSTQQNDSAQKVLQELILDPDLERLEGLLAEFNLFEVLRVERNEVRHSAVIAWLLNPRGSHKLGDWFLRRFLIEAVSEEHRPPQLGMTLSDVTKLDLGDCTVRPEHFITPDSGRVDIFLFNGNGKFVCFIENKIDAGEGEGQLAKYTDAADRQHPEQYPEMMILPIFLTPKGQKPQKESDKQRYSSLGYDTVVSLINEVLSSKRNDIDSSVAISLKQYAATLRRHVLNARSDIEELALKVYRKHPEAIDLIFKARKEPAAYWEKVAAVMEEYEDAFESVSSDRIGWKFYAPALKGIPKIDSRSLWFEIKDTESSKGIEFCLWIGPGKQRERIHKALVGQAPSIKGISKKKLIKGNHFIYRTQKIFFQTDDLPDIERKLRNCIDAILTGDYWLMVNAIREEFGLPPVSPSD